MIAERSKINYAKSVLRRQFTGALLTGGALVAGGVYYIAQLKKPDDFSNIGGPKFGWCRATVGLVFTATGINPTAWTGASTLYPFDLAGLKTKADQVFASASKTVTLTRAGFEGGDGSGEITFDRSALGIAIEELIQEFDPMAAPPLAAPNPRRQLGVRVKM